MVGETKMNHKERQEQRIMNGMDEDIVPKHQKGEEIDFTKTQQVVEEEDIEQNSLMEEKTLEIKNLFDKKILKREKNKFILDYDKMILDCPNADNYFMENPLETIELIKFEMDSRYNQTYPLEYENLEYSEEISNIRVEHLGKIVKVRGIIANATNMHALTVSGKWECPSCGTIMSVKGSDEPRRCSCGRRGAFNLIKKELVDIQELFIEENYDQIGSKSPKKVRIRLLDELCDKEFNKVIIPGTRVEIIGVSEIVPLPPKKNKTKEEISEFRLHALQIKSLENEFDETITNEDIEEMEYIAMHNPTKILVNSIAPNIKGRDLEKLGALLAMTRGNPSIKIDGREDKDTIHIMFIGDAGQGKTDINTACQRLHYKGMYADCIGMTAPSLTATAEQDKLTGAWGLKPGLLVKGNGGLVILDEFDKSKPDAKQALHTAMESKLVSINKGGINTTLGADCTLFFGANPKNSRFDPSKSIVEQIDLAPTILSRMDLIFVFRDLIDEEQDDIISSSILKLDKEEVFEILDTNLFRKYLKYIQRFKPILQTDAAEFLKTEYKKVRQKSKTSTGMVGMPLVSRHLKALVRLAEANAKLRMSDKVEMEDVKVVYNLFEQSLIKLGLEENSGIIDLARIGPGVTLKVKEKRETILSFIKVKDEEKGFASTEELEEFSKEGGMDKIELEKTLEDLKKEGSIFAPKYDKWKYIG